MAFGPPPKLTERDIQRAADLVKAGLAYSNVGFILGINKRTIMRYYADGRDLADQEADPDNLPSPLDLYLKFYLAVEKASSEAEKTMIGHVMRAAEGDWRAASWYLSRTNRDRWGEGATKVEHSGAVTTLSGALSEEQAEDIRRRIFGLPSGSDRGEDIE